MEHSGQVSPNDANLRRSRAQRRHGLDAGLLRVWLEIWAITGYGMWLLLGLALALGVYSSGRGEGLVPLSVATAFVAAGLMTACLPLKLMPHWHGWRPGPGSRPSREAMIALLPFLPMLAVAALVRGDNDFWATRLAGAILAICSLLALLRTASAFRARCALGRSAMTSHVPISRVISACYAGGLWLWVFVSAQDDQASMGGALYWVLSLLALALILGGVESVRWRALHVTEPDSHPRPRRHHSLSPMRFLAAVLMYALPCTALLATGLECSPLWLAIAAALGCGLGKALEQRLYEVALAVRARAARLP